MIVNWVGAGGRSKLTGIGGRVNGLVEQFKFDLWAERGIMRLDK